MSKNINKDLEDVFKPLGDITAPREELLDGTLDKQIFDEVFGRPITKKKKGKRNGKNKRSRSNLRNT